MAKWKPVVITKKGLALQAKVEGGAQLKFTRMALGSGTPSSLETATRLANEKQELEITSTSVDGNTCTIYGTTTNIKVQTEYKATELGLYAQDPSAGEILYAVTVDDAPDLVPSNSSATIVTQRIGIAVAMSSTARVSAVLTADGFITAQDAKNIADEMVREHARKATIDHPDKSITAEKLADKSVGSRALQDSGVSAGTYTSVTVDSKGRVTSGSKPTTLSGYNIADAYTKRQTEDLFVQVTKLFKGSTSSRSGESGLVPAPTSTQRDMFLHASGAWAPLPKVLSAFQNDTKYITLADVPTNVSHFTNDAKYTTLEEVQQKMSTIEVRRYD